jgi:hypothetical protein
MHAPVYSSGAGSRIPLPSVIVMIRTSSGGGTRLIRIEVPASITIAGLKQKLCCPPHSLCSDSSAVVLVSAGRVKRRCPRRSTNAFCYILHVEILSNSKPGSARSQSFHCVYTTIALLETHHHTWCIFCRHALCPFSSYLQRESHSRTSACSDLSTHSALLTTICCIVALWASSAPPSPAP